MLCIVPAQSDVGVLAHAGGLAAIDVRGDLIATCGYSIRMGQVVADNMVKVIAVAWCWRCCCVALYMLYGAVSACDCRAAGSGEPH